MAKRHIADGVYIRALCGRMIKADSDARWVQTAHQHRGVCKGCDAEETRRTHAQLLEELWRTITGSPTRSPTYAEALVEELDDVDGWDETTGEGKSILDRFGNIVELELRLDDGRVIRAPYGARPGCGRWGG